MKLDAISPSQLDARFTNLLTFAVQKLVNPTGAGRDQLPTEIEMRTVIGFGGIPYGSMAFRIISLSPLLFEDSTSWTAGSKRSPREVSFVMLQTVLKQERADHSSAELKKYADDLEQAARLGKKRRGYTH